MSFARPDSSSTGVVDVRVTQNDIARAAGVHNTTVSLALRNSPAIPEGTRKRIQALAIQMGYHPDPALQALVAYRRGRTVRERAVKIAYITNAETRWGWRSRPADELVYTGAARKAAQCGYQLEHFWLGESDMNQRRLSSMLFHRGITGALLASHRSSCDELLEIDWARISVVKIGCFPHAPVLHRVTVDQHGAVRAAMKRIAAAGNRRVGMVLPADWDECTDQAWSSAFLLEQNRLSGGQRIPILLGDAVAPVGSSCGDQQREEELQAEKLSKWFERYSPEVILGSWPHVKGALAECGIAVPENVRFVDLALADAGASVAGVRQNNECVGEVATEMLVGLMQQNICGTPPVPTATLVEGVWHDGASLPLPTHEPAWTVSPSR